jgi:Predicted carboxypeptidase
MRKDPFTQLENVQHSQYFNFRSCIQNMDNDETLNTRLVKYVLSNAGDVSFPGAWEGSTIFYSINPWDPSSWRRKLDTTFDVDKGELVWTHNHDSSSSRFIYFAYFPPYSYERHLSLISKCEGSPLATVESLGQTLDGREMECIRVGNGDKKCWIIHRKHPGETMAEFYAEGLLTRLLGLDKDYVVDGMVKDVLKMYTFYIVPNMCPDGAARGYLRTNAGGQNLNREWCSTGNKEDGESYYEAPTLERSPEVYHVLKKMDETGVDVFLDVHGDEALPFNFLAGSEGCPNWSDRLKSLHGAFLAQYSRTNSDMQSAIAYTPEQPGQGRMNVCSNQIAVRFDCLAATLEMPFKDCLSNPDPERGWNAARAAMLGASVLEPLAYVGPYLREGGELKNFGASDEYVTPTSDYKSLQLM